MVLLHLVCKIAGEENEEQNQECPFIADANDEEPAGNVVGEEDLHHVGKDPNKWKVSSCSIMFFLLPDDHMCGWVWICSSLIPLDEEEGTVCEGDDGDKDADFLGDVSKISSATDNVQLKN